MSQEVKVYRGLRLERGGSAGNQAAPVITVQVKNVSGGAFVRGDVVVLSKTSNFTADIMACTSTTTAADDDVLGMVYEAIANNGVGRVQIWGPTNALKVNGNTDITIGDWLTTFTTAKIAAKGTGRGSFALALEAYSTNDSAGVIDAFIANMDFLRHASTPNGAFELASGDTIDVNAAADGYAAFLRDVNNNELLDVNGITAAVNQFGISNGATGDGPILEARGETNVDIKLLAKGTGAFLLNNGTDPVIVKLLGAQAGYNNEFQDVNSNELLDFQGVASAVNEFGISNAATGNGPILEARGETNVDINLLAAGTGAVVVNNGTDPVVVKLLGAQAGYNNEIHDVNGNELLDLQGVASAVNEFGISNAATGNGPILSAIGETNVDINLVPAGTGAVVINNGTDPVVLKLMGAQAGYNNEIHDVNGNELLALQGVASALNEVKITNAATTEPPTIGVQGEANTGLKLDTAGTGQLILSLGGADALRLDDAAITNYLAANDTAGHAVFIELQSGGTDGGTASSGQAGASLTITAGTGSNGVTANSAGGAGGSLTLTAAAGGNGTGAGNGGGGGDIVFNPGAAGTGGTPDPAGLVKFGTAAQWTANAGGTVTISNVAPAGVGTATIDSWLTVKKNDGTVMYIPAWT